MRQPHGLAQDPGFASSTYGSAYKPQQQTYLEPHYVQGPPLDAGFASQSLADMSMPLAPRQGIPLTKNMFRCAGASLLLVLCALPVWDAFALLNDFNYTFWAGRNQPFALVLVAIVLFIVFFITADGFFREMPHQHRTTQTLAMIASIFVTCWGLSLVLVSMPVALKANNAHNMLLYQCTTDQSSASLRLHYAELLGLRLQPACATMYSVEDCSGFVEKEPYTSYLRALELNYQCSGFCYVPSETLAASTASSALPQVDAAAGSAAFLRRAPPAVPSAGAGLVVVNHTKPSDPFSDIVHPPTLFSTVNFQVTCDGAAARQLVNFAVSLANESWFIGITCIALAIVMGITEWGTLAADK